MKKLVILFFYFFSFIGFSQEVYKSQPTYWRGWDRFSTKELMEKHVKSKLAVYQFQKGERVASIGSGCGDLEIAYTFYSDSVAFYLEDINTEYLNQKEVDYGLKKGREMFGIDTKSSFSIVIGTPTQSNLPNNFFDKIIIENSFHEIDDVKSLLADVVKKLKPNGKLYIEDQLAQAKGQLHGGCNKPMYPEDELIKIVHDAGFLYLNTQPSTRHPILSFRKVD